MVEKGALDLQRLLDVPELRDAFLTHFHPKRLEDIQGVVSLWSLGLLKDNEKVREHFLDGRQGRHGEFLSLDMDIWRQRYIVRYAMGLERSALDDLSGDDLWSRYHFLSVIPKKACRFMVEGLKYRKEVMGIIMSRGVDELTTDESKTCLEYASRCGMIDMVSSFATSGKIPRDDESFSRSFFWAARNGDLDMLLMLCGQCDIEPDYVLIPEEFPSYTALTMAASDCDVRMVDVLIQTCKANSNRSALMFAAINGHTDVVDLLLTKYKASANDTDDMDNTPLLLAAEEGHTDIVDLLITNGASVDAKEAEYNHTALMRAAENGYTDMVDLLITKGNADVEATDKNGRTALMLAAEYGNTSAVYRLITKYNANVETTDHAGMTALMFAAKNGHTNTVGLLTDITPT
eukprot:jgi/Picsp_1/4220/NSC_01729-R1_ankyrin repeat protein